MAPPRPPATMAASRNRRGDAQGRKGSHMTTRQISRGIASSKPAWLMALLVTGATALAVVAVGIGTWRDARPHTVTMQSQASSPTGPSRVHPHVGSTPSGAPVETVYVLVSSQDDAAPLRELLASYSAPPPEGGQPLSIAVIVDRTNTFTADVALLSLPRSPIIDLRRPFAADAGS